MKFVFFLVFLIISANAQTPKLKYLFQSENLFDPKLASGGSITSVGGGDTADLSQLSAWFYNNGEIKTCMSYSAFFGVDEREVEIQIYEALKTWKNYFNENRINDFLTQDISTNFNFKKDCEGDEDLVLYFGTGPIFDNLLDVKASQKLNKPIAYVNKTHISEDLSWSRGYIRFVESSRYNKVSRDYPAYPDWSIKNSLYQLILHEIGHVLGFEHKSETIMDENISYDVFISRDFYPLNVDGVEDLFETKRKVKVYSPLEITNREVLSRVYKDEVPNIVMTHKNDGSVEVEFRYLNQSSQFYRSISVINTTKNIPLYSNFQNERGIFLKTVSAYFNVEGSVLSFSFEGNQTVLLVNGIKAAIYQEEI